MSLSLFISRSRVHIIRRQRLFALIIISSHFGQLLQQDALREKAETDFQQKGISVGAEQYVKSKSKEKSISLPYLELLAALLALELPIVRVRLTVRLRGTV